MPYSALDEMCLLDNEAECCVRIVPPSISKSLCSLNTRECSTVGLSLKIIRIVPSTPQCSSGLVVQRTRTSRCDGKGGADDYCVEDHRLQQHALRSTECYCCLSGEKRAKVNHGLALDRGHPRSSVRSSGGRPTLCVYSTKWRHARSICAD